MTALFRELGIQFTKFAGVGVIGTIGHYAVLVALVNLLGTNPVFSSGIGATVGAVINYMLNYRHTFDSKARHREAAPKVRYRIPGRHSHQHVDHVCSRCHIQYVLSSRSSLGDGFCIGVEFCRQQILDLPE